MRLPLKDLYQLLGMPYEEPKEEPQEKSPKKPRNHRPAMSYLNIKKTITPRKQSAEE